MSTKDFKKILDNQDWEFAKTAEEFAPGIEEREDISIPSRITSPVLTDLIIHAHEALKAKSHLDLRIADPKKGKLLSWTLRYWPKPGEKRLAIAQPFHSLEYGNFEGTIPSGYGAGNVKIQDEGVAEILESSPNKVTFSLFKGKKDELYSLIKTDKKNWLLLNRSLDRKLYPDIPIEKPKFEDIDWKTFDYENNNQLIQGKIDGTCDSIIFNENRPISVLSYRQPKDDKFGIIAHHAKLSNFFPIKTPNKFNDSILWGEVSFKDKNRKLIPLRETGGILNSTIMKARETIKNRELTPSIFLWGIKKFRGENYEDKPYKEQWSKLQEIVKEIPQFSLPPSASTPNEKLELVKSIEEGRNNLISEGIIIRDIEKKESKIKRSKITPTADRIIVGIEESKINPGTAGSFWYSDKDGGEKLGKVTIPQKLMKLDARNHPENYIGKWVILNHFGQYPSGALRQASLQDFHFEKNLE